MEDECVKRIEFSYMDSHCRYEPDAVLEGVDKVVVAFIKTQKEKLEDLDTWDWNQLNNTIRAHLLDNKPANPEVWEEATELIDSNLHNDHCDCGQWEAEWHADHINEVFETFETQHPGVQWFIYQSDDIDDKDNECIWHDNVIDFATLLEQDKSNGHDGFTLELNTKTGEGKFGFSDRGYGTYKGIYAVTCPEKYQRIDTLANWHGGYESDFIPWQLHDTELTDEMMEEIETIIDTADGISKYRSYWDKQDYILVSELGPARLMKLLKDTGYFQLNKATRKTILNLAKTHTGFFEDLIEACKAAVTV